jgi:hypothetical protein
MRLRSSVVLLALAACQAPTPPPPRPAPKLAPKPVVEVAATVDAAESDALKAALDGTAAPPAPIAISPPPSRLRRAPKRVIEDLPEPELPAGPPSLSDAEFADAVNGWKGMRRCLDTDVSRVDARAGALKVALTIRGDGAVTEAKVLTASEGAAKSISDCVEKSTLRIRFPAFADAGSQITKEAKFIF